MISPSKGTRIVRGLESKGLVRAHPINTGGRGGSVKLHELTDKAYEAIGMKPKQGIGKGAGFEHGFWQYHLRERLRHIERIQNVAIEGKLFDKCIDLLIDAEDKGKVAIEIAMTPDHEKVNIEKDISSGAARVFVACRDKTVFANVSHILDSLSQLVRNKVKLCLVQHLVSEVQLFIQDERINGLS